MNTQRIKEALLIVALVASTVTHAATPARIKSTSNPCAWSKRHTVYVPETRGCMTPKAAAALKLNQVKGN